MTEVKEKNTQARQKRAVSGVVVSAAMDKTIVVKVERKFKHATIGKIVRTFKKYKAHDEANEAKAGDVVEIVESRPLSRTKHMQLQRVIKAKKVAASKGAA